MEDKAIEMTQEEKDQKKYTRKLREYGVARTRAGVVRNQILRAYEIIEGIRFDFVGDTAFRDKITTAKRGMEGAIGDFLLNDTYWKERIENMLEMTPQQYIDSIKPSSCCGENGACSDCS